MYNSIIQAECVNLNKLEHLFIDLEYKKNTSSTINVYRSRCFNQKNKKYLQFDEIKEALSQIDAKQLKYIYLTGENSMLHPEFNHILRLCLTKTSVTIFSDGTCINDKKSRFLKRVEEESCNEIIFKIYINHYDERKNDEISGRGSFRKAVHAITSLNKYGFNPILVISSFEPDVEDLKQGFVELGKKFHFDTEDLNLSFVPSFEPDIKIAADCAKNISKFDCMHSRIFSKSGVYNCPHLLNDYRGHSGATLKDFSKKCYLETEKCNVCKIHGSEIFVNHWE